MPKLPEITYHTGAGKSARAYYQLGKATVPASMVTRMLANLTGKTGAALDRIFYQSLTKHESFLEAMETFELVPDEAVSAFLALKPAKKVSANPRVSKVEKTAVVFAKGICKRFKGTPEEMVTAFLDSVSKPEFKAEAVEIISGYLKDYGKSPTGFVKASDRKANPAALAALAKSRADKKQ